MIVKIEGMFAVCREYLDSQNIAIHMITMHKGIHVNFQ